MMNTSSITQIRARLIAWYQNNHRRLPWRETQDPYPIWVSEVMLQQTQVQTVLPYYQKFLHLFPTLNDLARADLHAVLKAWEGMGYYGRARNLHAAAKIVMEEHAGRIPDTMKALRSLPGIGEYIASAVLSIVFHKPQAVLDGNAKRVIARLVQVDEPVNHSASHKTFRHIAHRLLDTDHPGLFNQAIMELGATICKPRNPFCNRCPVRRFCLACQTKTVDTYPKRNKPRPVPTHHIVVGVVYKNDRVLITQRKPDGLLGGLWEFPGGHVEDDEDAESACVREIKEEVNLSIKIDRFLTRVNHAYTHFKIVMDVFRCIYVSGDVKLNGPVDCQWVTVDEIDRFALPKANLKFIPMLKEGHGVTFS